jgi:hypothetical protein
VDPKETFEEGECTHFSILALKGSGTLDAIGEWGRADMG